MGCILLPEGENLEAWVGSATIFPACLRDLDVYRSWSEAGWSQSPSLQSEWYAAVCTCSWQRLQQNIWWWRRWRWTQWWLCKSAPPLPLTDCHRKYILCWALEVTELMVSSHLWSSRMAMGGAEFFLEFIANVFRLEYLALCYSGCTGSQKLWISYLWCQTSEAWQTGGWRCICLCPGDWHSSFYSRCVWINELVV